MVIRLKPDAVPYCITTARKIPLALKQKVKDELDDMVRKGVIERVGDRTTEWCHPLVVVSKPNGDVRITVDLTKLNSQVQRTIHNSPSPAEIVADRRPNAKYWTTLDAKSGYWQVPLSEESRDLTVFLCCFGKYRYKRSPMGFISSGDSYCYRGDIAPEGIEHVRKIVDDIIAEDEDLKEHFDRVCSVLERCRKYRITINPRKFAFGQAKVKFAGYVISRDGIGADPDKVRAIAEFPTPTNPTEVRSFMGIVQQLGQF